MEPIEDIVAFVQGLTDQEVMEDLNGAVICCRWAQENCPDSETHVACFKAVRLYWNEAYIRGLVHGNEPLH